MSLSSSHSCSCLEDELEEFAPVLASINVNGLALYASRIRQQHQYANCQDCSTASIHCEVLLPPLHGSYHILFQLKFTDGLRWIIKIPVNGYLGQFDEMSARAVKSEAFTMQLLKRETKIPLPEVYSFDASTDNELHCPFILMEFIQGISLSDRWFRPRSSLVSVEGFRANVLKDIATAMVQLNKFAYNQSGSLIFDDKGNVTGIGPAKVFDGPAHLKWLLKSDGNKPNIFFEMGPFYDPKSSYFSAFERHAEIDPSSIDAKFDIGIEVLLRLFISWVPLGDAEGSEFVLRHPDLNVQNILVSEEGHLRGIIDWDGVAAAPRDIGCEQYPMWLIPDWNPYMYQYRGSDSDDPEHSPDRCTDPDSLEHSPKELAFYRSMYAGFMDVCLAKEESRGSVEVPQRTANAKSCFKPPTHFTRRSLLLQSLELASTVPMFTGEVVCKIFDKIQEITAPEYDVFEFDEDLQNGGSFESGCDGTTLSSVASGHSDKEEEDETTGITHQADEGEIMSHQSFNEEEDNKDSSPLQLIETNTATSEEEHYDSNARFIPSRLEQYGLDNTDEVFPESHQLEETFQVLHGENKAFDSQDLASATSQSTESSYSSMTARSENISAAGFEPQSESDNFGVGEKFTLAQINREKMKGVGDDNDTMTDTDQGNKYLVFSDFLEVDEGAAWDNSIGLGKPNHKKMATVDDDTNHSGKTDREETSGPCDDTDTSISQEDTEEIVENDDGIRKHSAGYDGVGFTAWEVTHSLADGVLDEDRMRRLKNGFFALLASLDGERAVPAVGSGTGTE